MNNIYERLSVMAYQNEHILILDNQLFTVLQKSWCQLKGGANVTASLYSQCALTCFNPGRVEYLCCDVTGLCGLTYDRNKGWDVLVSLFLCCCVTPSYCFKHCTTHKSLSFGQAMNITFLGGTPTVLFLLRVGMTNATPSGWNVQYFSSNAWNSDTLLACTNAIRRSFWLGTLNDSNIIIAAQQLQIHVSNDDVFISCGGVPWLWRA